MGKSIIRKTVTVILGAISQDYTGELTSMTQYSAVYNNKERKIEVCMYPDYSHKYRFKL